MGHWSLFWYNNSQLCYAPFGGYCDNQTKDGMIHMSVGNRASEYKWFLGAYVLILV